MLRSIIGVLFKPSIGAQLTSMSLRARYKKIYGIEIGLYSYGCFDRKRIPSGTIIGRYCSFASTAFLFNGNHGLGFLTLHPFAYNRALGLVPEETIVRSHCVVEDDVWVGHNAIITPSVKFVGRGSVIAAGAVVTRDVERYSIVAGNPARRIRMRFDESIISKIESTCWWEWDRTELARKIIEQPSLIYDPATYFFGR